MIETLSLVAFLLAILFVALMAPKPSGRDTKPSANGPSANGPSANGPSGNAPSGKGADPSGQEKKDPDSSGE